MRIAILGTGRIGSALGGGWTRAGHTVVYGSRDPATADVGADADVTSHAEAVDGAEVVVVATPPDGAADVLAAAGDLAGTVVVDVTNAVAIADGALRIRRSQAEIVAAAAPGAHVVKAFNTIGLEHLDGPDFPVEVPMLVAGDDPAARATVLRLAEDLGFRGLDAGPLANAPLLEHVAGLWIWLAGPGGHGRDIAITVVER